MRNWPEEKVQRAKEHLEKIAEALGVGYTVSYPNIVHDGTDANIVRIDHMRSYGRDRGKLFVSVGVYGERKVYRERKKDQTFNLEKLVPFVHEQIEGRERRRKRTMASNAALEEAREALAAQGIDYMVGWTKDGIGCDPFVRQSGGEFVAAVKIKVVVDAGRFEKVLGALSEVLSGDGSL